MAELRLNFGEEPVRRGSDLTCSPAPIVPPAVLVYMLVVLSGATTVAKPPRAGMSITTPETSLWSAGGSASSAGPPTPKVGARQPNLPERTDRFLAGARKPDGEPPNTRHALVRPRFT
jgi:hypothetical protein